MTLTLAAVYNQWAAIGILFLIGLGFAVFNVVLSHMIGPKREGKVKMGTYESGMDPVGDTHQRFNVRFYLVAVSFLVFDVEVLFLVPWAMIFVSRDALGLDISTLALFLGMLVFVGVVMLSYVYDLGKKVLEWD